MAESDVWILLGHFNHIIFMSMRQCKDHLATIFRQFPNCCSGFRVFRYIIFVDNLRFIQPERFRHLPGGLVMVIGISHIAGIREMDKSYL